MANWSGAASLGAIGLVAAGAVLIGTVIVLSRRRRISTTA
jgi:hypothetical protein